jgi:hypothetical protein
MLWGTGRRPTDSPLLWATSVSRSREPRTFFLLRQLSLLHSTTRRSDCLTVFQTASNYGNPQWSLMCPVKSSNSLLPHSVGMSNRSKRVESRNCQVALDRPQIPYHRLLHEALQCRQIIDHHSPPLSQHKENSIQALCLSYQLPVRRYFQCQRLVVIYSRL